MTIKNKSFRPFRLPGDAPLPFLHLHVAPAVLPGIVPHQERKGVPERVPGHGVASTLVCIFRRKSQNLDLWKFWQTFNQVSKNSESVFHTVARA